MSARQPSRAAEMKALGVIGAQRASGSFCSVTSPA
jgi:hypothetical protein